MLDQPNARANKGDLLIKMAAHALLVGLQEIPIAGVVVKIGHGCWKILRDHQQALPEPERLLQLEQAAACSPDEVRAAAEEAIAELRHQGTSVDAARAEAVTDLIAVMPARIREHTRATLTRAHLHGTTTLVPLSAAASEAEQEAFYTGLFPPRRPQFSPGDALPNHNPAWRLEQLLGVGGFGEVWLARNRQLVDAPRWAVKFCQDAKGARILKREADNLNTLRRKLPTGSPHLVPLTDLQLQAEPYWVAFEYVDGGTLSALLASGPLPWERARRLFEPILAGMAQVHDLGIVHRDIKPANILLTQHQEPRITDFGIGKATAAVDSAARRGGDSFTTTGYGTQGYMSPEQAAGLPADPADDVYALGVLLWEMLAGVGAPLHFEAQVRALDAPQAAKDAIGACRFQPRGERPEHARALLEQLAGRSPKPHPTATPNPEHLREDLAWQRARRKDSIAAYRAYLADQTIQRQHTDEAHNRIDDLTWNAIRRADEVASYERYLADTSIRRAHANEAHGRILELEAAQERERQAQEKAQAQRIAKGEGLTAAEVRQQQRAAAETLGVPLAFHDKLRGGGKGPDMCVIPAGRFWMGSPEDEPEHQANETRHLVTLTRPFALARYAVTRGEWRAYLQATGKKPASDQADDRLPAVNLSWHDAVAYCEWLSEQTGARYRLPSEAEWEYACRAGTVTPFWWGSELTTERANYDGDYPYNNGPKGEDRGKTVAVDQFEPNPWGLYQVHGNVWEWCQDWFADYPEGEQTDPIYDGGGSLRVLRGGGWLNGGRFLRAAYRRGVGPGDRDGVIGLRPARTF